MPYEVKQTSKRIWQIDGQTIVVEEGAKFEVATWFNLTSEGLSKLHACLGHVLMDLSDVPADDCAVNGANEKGQPIRGELAMKPRPGPENDEYRIRTFGDFLRELPYPNVTDTDAIVLLDRLKVFIGSVATMAQRFTSKKEAPNA